MLQRLYVLVSVLTSSFRWYCLLSATYYHYRSASWSWCENICLRKAKNKRTKQNTLQLSLYAPYIFASQHSRQSSQIMCLLGLDLLLRQSESVPPTYTLVASEEKFKYPKQLITTKKIIKPVAVEGIKSITLEHMWWRTCNSVLMKCKEDCLVSTMTERYIPQLEFDATEVVPHLQRVFVCECEG